jgi:hypothetical protein
MNFEEAVRVIAGARAFSDLVGPAEPVTAPAMVAGSAGVTRSAMAGGVNAEFPEPVEVYRRFSKIVHPDVAPATEGPRATEAFAKLSALWSAFEPGGPGRSGNSGASTGGFSGALSGDIAELTPHNGGRALRKVPRLTGDNDLMTAEATALRTLWTNGDPRYRAYAPRLIESVRDDRKRVNVLERLDGFITLAEVMRLRPGGIDARDAAWMWRRLLTALGWAHRAGVVHGAVLPAHVLIHPDEHGVVLVDWCYSVATGTPLTALVAQHRADYPPEVLAKQPVTPATDVYLATVLMRRLIRQPPAPIARFLDGCLYDAPLMRPQDAWALLAELDEVLFACFGPRRFRPFTLPKGS